MRASWYGDGVFGVKNGFTMVELSLSLVFISILSLAVVVVIMGAVSSYHKSITLNEVDEVGTNVVDDIRSSIQASSPMKLANVCDGVPGVNASWVTSCKSNPASLVISRVTANVTVGSRTMNNVPVRGALCTGKYSYVWNSGYYFGNYSVGTERKAITVLSFGEYKDFRLLKVKDESRVICARNFVQDGGQMTADEEPVELLASSEGSGLALYDLAATFAEQVNIEKNIFYYGSFILGTVQGGVNIMANGNFCKVPEDDSTGGDVAGYFDYCAINKFNFAALASGGRND